MRDYRLGKIYESASNEGKTYVGDLIIGKHKLFTNKELTEYDYESNKDNKKIISTPTRNNIEKLKEYYKSGAKIERIIRAMLTTTRVATSTFVVGTLYGEPFIWARRETNNAMGGYTRIYFKDTYMTGSGYLELLEDPNITTLTEMDDGTYRINNKKQHQITYTTEYKKIKVGPDMYMYEPAGKYHRISNPAIIGYFSTDKDKAGIDNIYSAQFFENGRQRFIIMLDLSGGFEVRFGEYDSYGNLNSKFVVPNKPPSSFIKEDFNK